MDYHPYILPIYLLPLFPLNPSKKLRARGGTTSTGREDAKLAGVGTSNLLGVSREYGNMW